MYIIGDIRKYRKYEVMLTSKGWEILKLSKTYQTYTEAMDAIDEYEDARQ